SPWPWPGKGGRPSRPRAPTWKPGTTPSDTGSMGASSTTRSGGCGTASAWTPPADRGNDDDFTAGGHGREHPFGFAAVHHHHQVGMQGAVGAEQALPGFGIAAGQILEGGSHGGAHHVYRV